MFKRSQSDEEEIQRRQATVDLIIAYHMTARDELNARIERRDAVVFWYLAAVGAFAGLIIANYPASVAAVLLVPAFGLGVTVMHSRHNMVIGVLAVYIGTELADAARGLLGLSTPMPWDGSTTLLSSRTPALRSFASTVVILVGPQVLSVGVAIYELEPTGPAIAGIIAAVLASTASCLVLLNAHAKRGELRKLREASLGR